MKNRGHRPRGPMSKIVRIIARKDHLGYFLYIGMDVYQELGRPEQVLIDVNPSDTTWKITACTRLHTEYDYTVADREGGVPRLAMGVARFEELGLFEGQYATNVNSDGNTSYVTLEYLEDAEGE
jgi:hypothetical protein